MNKRNMMQKFGAGVVGLLASVPAFAAIDVSAAVTEIESGTAAVTAIGGAALVVLATAALFKYVRRAF